MAVAYYPKESPDATNYGFARLKCTETTDPDNNRSTVLVEFQIKPITVSYRYNLKGTITFNGVSDTLSGRSSALAKVGEYTTVWSKSYTVDHDEDGKKTVSIWISGSNTNGLEAWVSEGTYYSMWVPSNTYSLHLTDFDNGSLVKIDDGSAFQEYFIYIDNGTSFDKYDAYIDNGSSWAKI